MQHCGQEVCLEWKWYCKRAPHPRRMGSKSTPYLLKMSLRCYACDSNVPQWVAPANACSWTDLLRIVSCLVRRFGNAPRHIDRHPFVYDAAAPASARATSHGCLKLVLSAQCEHRSRHCLDHSLPTPSVHLFFSFCVLEHILSHTHMANLKTSSGPCLECW